MTQSHSFLDRAGSWLAELSKKKRILCAVVVSQLALLAPGRKADLIKNETVKEGLQTWAQNSECSVANHIGLVALCCWSKMRWFQLIAWVFLIAVSNEAGFAGPIGIGAGSTMTLTHCPFGDGLPCHIEKTDYQAGARQPFLNTIMEAHTDVSGSGESFAVGQSWASISPPCPLISCAEFYGFRVASGAGVSQIDLASDIGPSTLTIAFDINFLFDDRGFPSFPDEYSFQVAWFPLVTFAAPGDRVSFDLDATFFSTIQNAYIGPGITLHYENNGLGATFESLTFLQPTAFNVPGNDTVRFVGSAVFSADSQSGMEASIFAVSEDGKPFGIGAPEPGSLSLLGGALALTGILRRKLRA